MTVFWDAAPCSLAIALMMEAARTSETSVNVYQTIRRNIPEDSHLKPSNLLKGTEYLVISWSVNVLLL
jgi:hypothetical protein